MAPTVIKVFLAPILANWVLKTENHQTLHFFLALMAESALQENSFRNWRLKGIQSSVNKSSNLGNSNHKREQLLLIIKVINSGIYIKIGYVNCRDRTDRT